MMFSSKKTYKIHFGCTHTNIFVVFAFNWNKTERDSESHISVQLVRRWKFRTQEEELTPFQRRHFFKFHLNSLELCLLSPSHSSLFILVTSIIELLSLQVANIKRTVAPPNGKLWCIKFQGHSYQLDQSLQNRWPCEEDDRRWAQCRNIDGRVLPPPPLAPDASSPHQRSDICGWVRPRNHQQNTTKSIANKKHQGDSRLFPSSWNSHKHVKWHSSFLSVLRSNTLHVTLLRNLA